MYIDRDGTIIRGNQERSNGSRSNRSRSNRGSSRRGRRIQAELVRTPPAIFAVLFYIITIILSAAVSLSISYYANELVFADKFGGGLACLMMILAGIAGCIIYNLCFACFYNFPETCLSVLCTLAAALIVGVAFFIILSFLKIILIIIGIAVILFVILCITCG